MNSKPHILVVDDSPPFQKLLTGILTKRGYQVSVAESVERALDIIRNQKVNIVLSEIILPGLSGLSLLKTLRSEMPTLDMVIVTGNASDFNAIKALRLGAADFIVKPLDDEEILCNVVARTLERRTLTEENRRLLNDLKSKNLELEIALKMMQSLNKCCAILVSSLDIGEILRKLVEIAVEQLRAKKGYLLLLDKTGNQLSMKVSVGIEHSLAKSFTLRHDQGISGLVVFENRPLRFADDLPPALTQRLLEEDICGVLYASPGILSVPLQVKGKVVGVVNISGRLDGSSFSEVDTEFLTTLAAHAAIALDHAGTFYKLKKKNKPAP